jgi:hypothetical protein
MTATPASYSLARAAETTAAAAEEADAYELAAEDAVARARTWIDTVTRYA